MLTIAFTDGTIRPWEDDEAKHIFWHSSAHLMAEALEALYPGVKFGVGPAVETGFYYDVDLGDRQISEADLAKVEAKMIELAGGKYIFSDLGNEEDNNLSTVNLDMETFYATAKDADYIFYNSTIMGEVSSIDNLKSLSPLLKDFKAVKEGNVWCTGQNLYQQTTDLGQMILEFNRILSGETDGTGLTYMKKLN